MLVEHPPGRGLLVDLEQELDVLVEHPPGRGLLVDLEQELHLNSWSTWNRSWMCWSSTHLVVYVVDSWSTWNRSCISTPGRRARIGSQGRGGAWRVHGPSGGFGLDLVVYVVDSWSTWNRSCISTPGRRARIGSQGRGGAWRVHGPSGGFGLDLVVYVVDSWSTWNRSCISTPGRPGTGAGCAGRAPGCAGRAPPGRVRRGLLVDLEQELDLNSWSTWNPVWMCWSRPSDRITITTSPDESTMSAWSTWNRSWISTPGRPGTRSGCPAEPAA